jgi:hypothetical protein
MIDWFVLVAAISTAIIGAYFLGVRHERARWVDRARVAFRHRERG